MGIENYSTTPGNNNGTPPNGAPEDMNPNKVNDTMRQMMADIRSLVEALGWINLGDTPAYASATTFTMPGDRRTQYPAGRRIKLYGATMGTLYGVINTSAYSSSTTVTVTLDSGSLDASLSLVQVGLVEARALFLNAATQFADNAISGDKLSGGTADNMSLSGTYQLSGTATGTLTWNGTLNVSGGTLTLADNQISGNKIDGGVISNFASTGIDDNATSGALTLDSSNIVRVKKAQLWLNDDNTNNDVVIYFKDFSSSTNVTLYLDDSEDSLRTSSSFLVDDDLFLNADASNSNVTVNFYSFANGQYETLRWVDSGSDQGFRFSGPVMPSTDNAQNLGKASYRWQAVYAVNGTIQTSDEREKRDIVPLALDEALFESIEPIAFKRKDDPEGRLHWGFGARHTEKALSAHGITGHAMIHAENDKYSMNYSELLPALWVVVQNQQQQIKELRNDFTALRLAHAKADISAR